MVMVRAVTIAILLAFGLIGPFERAAATQQKDKNPGQEKNDTVRLRDGSSFAGLVTSDNLKEVKLTEKGATRTFRQEEVAVVEYSDAPKSYVEAMTAYENLDYQKASSEFKKARDEKGRPWLAEYATYYLALSYKNLTRLEEAAQELKKVRQNHPLTKFLRETFEQEMDCYLKLKIIQSARDLLSQIDANLPNLDAQFPSWMRLSLADLLLSMGQKDAGSYTEARKEYSALARSTDPEVATRAAAGEVECLLRLNQLDELEKMCRERTRAGGAPGALMVAYNGLGMVLTQKAEAAQEKKDPKTKSMYRDALNVFQTTLIQFPQSPRSPMAREQVKALLFSSRIYEKLTLLYPDEPQVKHYRYMIMATDSDMLENYGDLLETDAKKEVTDRYNKVKALNQ